jgi:hypothetical protein
MTVLLVALLAAAPDAGLGATPDPASTDRAQTGECRSLELARRELNELLEVHVATTCEYRITWNGWSPPREYVYRPDADGWVSDYFIIGDAHGQVYWNLRTNAARVRPREGRPLDLDGAKRVAEWAKTTNFPGLDLSKLDFSLCPVP